MSFTEIVLEVGDSRFPLCRYTRAPYQAHGIYRIIDTGQSSRRFRAHVTYYGSDEGCAEMLRDVLAIHGGDAVEILHEGAGTLALSIETPILDGTAPGMGFLAVTHVLQSFGLDTLLEPFVASEGRIRARLLVPRPLETQDALRSLQEIQRAVGFAEFRILRVASVEPSSHVEMVRRILPPEQEELLSLAASMGYYNTPKGVTLEQIAGNVGLSISPVHKRLKAAEESLVSLHVQPVARAEPRRRLRRDVTRVEPGGPWEITLRVQAQAMGPSGFISQTPDSRALLQVLSEDRAARAATMLMVVLAPEDDCTKLISSLEDRPDIASVQVIARDRQHTAVRLTTRDRGSYGFGAWSDVWAGDAVLRPVLFDGQEITLRFVLTRPHTQERFQTRLAEAAKASGWTRYEVVSMRPLRGRAAAPTLPEPLTPRQLEVLRVAHALGYYRTPRGCTLEQVATTLGVSANAIHKNLVLAESKLIAAYLVAGL